MIYVDVTAACLLPLQSGIPRTTRGLFRWLSGNREGVVPVLWQPFFHGYTGLSPRARQLLDDPFAGSGPGETPPRDWTVPLLWASWKHAWSGPRRLRLRRDLRAGDTLLVTSLFPDNRLLYLDDLLSGPGRKVVIFHDAIPLADPHVPRLGKPFHRKLLALYAKFDRVVCVSRAAEAELRGLWERQGINPAPTVVIPWPVPFTGERPEFTPPGTGRRSILYVARLKRVKNHAVLLQACEQLWKEGLDFQLELIGCEDVPYESRGVLRAIGRLRALGHPVAWRGHVGEAELHAAYAASTFTVFPSLMEGFGLPIVESFWHGRGVVCGAKGATGEVSQGGGAVAADVSAPELLATALKSLLENLERCRTLALAAYERPVRTWEDYGKDLEAHL